MPPPSMSDDRPGKRCAVLDIGSNSIKLLVVDLAPGTLETLVEEVIDTRLSEGAAESGRLTREARERTLDAMAILLARAEERGVAPPDGVVAIGTACLREAANSIDLLEECRRRLGLEIEILSGEEEARLSSLAAATAPAAASMTAPIMAIDIGGSSVELARLERPAPTQPYELKWCRSLPLGAVRLLERYTPRSPVPPAALSDLLAALQRALSPYALELDNLGALIGIGGTFTTLAAMDQGLDRHDPTKLESYPLSLPSLQARLEQLASMAVEEREGIRGLKPSRTDIIIPGTAVAVVVATKAALPQIMVTTRGLRHGLALARLPACPQTAPQHVLPRVSSRN